MSQPKEPKRRKVESTRLADAIEALRDTLKTHSIDIRDFAQALEIENGKAQDHRDAMRKKQEELHDEYMRKLETTNDRMSDLTDAVNKLAQVVEDAKN